MARQGRKSMAAQVPAEVPTGKQGRKRAATQAPAEEPTAKRAADFLREHGITKASYEPVLEVVWHPLSGLPNCARELLLAILPWSLAVPADKRHATQQAAVRMVDGVAETVQLELQQAVDAETGKVDELKATRAELEGSAQRAELAGDEARRAVEERGRELAEAAAALLQRREALQEAEREEVRLGAELEKMRALTSELEEALSGSFRRLRDGDYEEEEGEALLQVVLVAAAKSCLEETLVMTLPGVLAQRERGAFGQTVMCGAEQGIRGKIAALREVAEIAAAPLAAQGAAVQAARAALDAEAGDQARAAERLCSAQAVSSEAAVAAKATRGTAAELDARLAPALAARDARRVELEHFRSYNVSLFEPLRDRRSKKEPAEQPEKEPAGEVTGTGVLAALAGA